MEVQCIIVENTEIDPNFHGSNIIVVYHGPRGPVVAMYESADAATNGRGRAVEDGDGIWPMVQINGVNEQAMTAVNSFLTAFTYQNVVWTGLKMLLAQFPAVFNRGPLEVFKPEPLRLSTARFPQELYELTDIGKLSPYLSYCLNTLVRSFLGETLPPKATPELVAQARQYLAGGIILQDSGSDRDLDVVYVVPNIGQEMPPTPVFQLVPKFAGGKLRYLEDVV